MQKQTVLVAATLLVICSLGVVAFAEGETLTYYPGGNLESVTFLSEDAEGNIYYHYKDENWPGLGHGRTDRIKRGFALAGEWTFSLIYNTDVSGRLKYKLAYSDSNWSALYAQYSYANDAANRVVVKKVYEPGNTTTYSYFNNAANRMYTKASTAPDTAGNVYYRYMDEEWQGQGYGRTYRIKRGAALDGEWTSTFVYNADAAGRQKYKLVYSDAAWSSLSVKYTYANDINNRIVGKSVYEPGNVTTYSYFNNEFNRLYTKTTTAPDAGGNVYYRYIDEDWQGQGYGRIFRIKRSAAAGNELTYAMLYYADADGRLQRKSAYSDGAWSVIAATYYYFNDSDNRLRSKVLKENNVTVTYLYYNNSPNRMRTKTLADGFAYSYSDEDWNGRGYGRLERQTFPDGSYKTFEYHSGIEQPRYVREHTAGGVWTVEYEYDEHGRFIGKVLPDGTEYTYYAGTGNMKTEELPAAPYGLYDFDVPADKHIKSYYLDTPGFVRYRVDNITDGWYVEKTPELIAKRDLITNEIIHGYSWIERYPDNTFKRQKIGDGRVPGIYGPMGLTEYDENGRVVLFSNLCSNYQTYDRSNPGQVIESYYSGLYGIEYGDPLLNDVQLSELQYKLVYDMSGQMTGRIENDGTEYTYYVPGGRMSSKTLPDGTKYDYSDEDWNLQGYGKLIRETRPDGTYKLFEEYYEGTNQYRYVREYSAEGALLATYEYDQNGQEIDPGACYTYYAASGLLESKTLLAPDAWGNVYYHYLDENWNGRGYGRPDKYVSPLADHDGAKGYAYTYSLSTIVKKECYAEAAYTDPSNPALTALLMTLEYYASGRLASKALSTPEVFGGNVYYHYLDEDWGGCGRIDKVRKAEAVNGEHSFTYEYFGDLNGREFRRTSYSDANWTMIAARYTFFNDPTGRVASKEVWENGTMTAYTYYNEATAYMESKTMPFPDANGNVSYHYIDENWNCQGYGRVDGITMADGRYKIFTDHFAGTAQPKYVSEYLPGGMLLVTYEYNQAGRLISKTLAMPDTGGWSYYQYLDEDWAVQGLGRLARQARPDGTFKTFTYFPGTDRFEFAAEHAADGTITVTYEYYESGNLKRSFTPGGLIHGYYDAPGAGLRYKTYSQTRFLWPGRYGTDHYYFGYSDEDIDGRGYGRLTTEIRNIDPSSTSMPPQSVPKNGGELFEYYEGTDNILKKWSYAGGDFTDPLDPVLTGFDRLYFYLADGTLEGWSKYYNDDPASRVKTERYMAQHEGWVFFEYFNEDWNGTGSGRIYRKHGENHANGLVYEYHEGTDIPSRITAYQAVNDGDPDNPLFFGAVTVSEYDEEGNLISTENGTETLTYYPDTGFLMVRIMKADGTRYEYTNEDWNGTGHGRLVKEIRPNGIYRTFEGYYEGTEQARYVREYSDTGVLLATCEYDAAGVLIGVEDQEAVYTYYPGGRLWSKTLFTPDPWGGVSYYYTDEDWNRQGYGRLIKQTLANGDHKTFEDYFAGTDQARYVKEYLADDTLVVTNEYSREGRFLAKALASPDPGGWSYYRYLDENWQEQGFGRMELQERPDGSRREFDYYDGAAQFRFVREYDADGTLAVTYGYDEEGQVIYEDTYYGDGKLKKRTFYGPDEDGVLVYEYFYGPTGPDPVRERRYYGAGEVVREFLPGDDVAVKVMDRENGVVYRKVAGNGSGLTLKIRYYEDWPESGNPWNSFDLGPAGENVYVKDVMIGTHLKQRFVYVSSGDLDLEEDIAWENAVKRTPDGYDWSTPVEIDVPKYSMYELEPHWQVGEPGRPLSTFPFTYYASGRVRTWFEHTVPEGWFTRSEESTGRVYGYADESFYAEESTRQFLADLMYSSKGSLSDGGLKYFLSRVDPADFGTVAELRGFIFSCATEENNYAASDVEDLLLRMPMTGPYEAHGRLDRVTEADGTYRVFEYAGETDRISAVRTYDIQGRLLEERVSQDPAKTYINVGSLPWVRYGEQLGTRWYDGWHGGFSKGRSGVEELNGYEELRAMMKKWAGKKDEPAYVRMFLMADLRAGVVFDENGVPTGFTEHVYDDMDVLLQAASELNIKLLPTLFDYRIADGYSSSIERDFPGFFTDQTLYNGKTKAEWLVDLFRPFIEQYGNNENIYAWDIMNEPEMMGEAHNGAETGITMDRVTAFLRGFVKMIHEETYDAETNSWAKVTVGSLTKGDMAKYWIAPDNALVPGDTGALDLYQFHYYDSSKVYHNADHESLNYSKNSLNALSAINDGMRFFNAPTYLGTKAVICGELDPTYVADKLDTLAVGGYDGMIFWDDKGNMLSARELQEAREWTYGKVSTYDPATGSVVSERGPGLADPEFVFYHYDDAARRDIAIRKNTDADGAVAYAYEYHAGTSVVSVEKGYHTVEFDTNGVLPALTNPVCERTFDQDGELSGTTWVKTYYPDTWFAMSETLATADDFGVTYRKFLNESRNVGNGREEIEYNPGWGYAYDFQYRGDEYTRIGAFKYSGIDISDPSHPVLSGFSGYESWSKGIETISYYDPGAGIIESRTFTQADNYGNIYYHYLNDDWHNAATNYMRVDSCSRAGANEKGELAFGFEYYSGDIATSVSRILSYSDEDMTELVAGYEFDADGRMTASRLYSGPNANGESAFGYEYYDAENGAGYHFVTSYDSTDMNEEDEMTVYEYEPDGSPVTPAEPQNMMRGSADEEEVLGKNDILAKKTSEFTGYQPVAEVGYESPR